jgi:hypothetical protein
MALTNLTILIPGRKVYCDFRIELFEINYTDTRVTKGNFKGTWQVISGVTPYRKDYTKFNFFVDEYGDAYFQGVPPLFNLFLFPFGKIYAEQSPPGFARIDMEKKSHIFSPGKAQWAKRAELIPTPVEVIAIFWQ